MTDTEPAQPAPPQAGPSRSSSSRADMEGLGKFKVRQYQRSSAPPPKSGSSYKAKFFVLKETYDAVTARHEELLRELQIANSKLKAVQTENDLLLDAMQIVTPSQPSLIRILQQMDPEPLPASSETYPAYGTSYAPPPPPSGAAYAPSALPEHIRDAEPDVDAPPPPPPPPLNGNGNGYVYPHSHSHGTNGRSRRALSRSPGDAVEPADHEMIDAEREHEQREYVVVPPGSNVGTDGR